VLDPVWGRRRDFLDGEKFNEIVNFPAQCVPGWSTIPTKNGAVPIKDLVGTQFTTWTGHCWAKATAIPKGLARLIRVNFSDGSSFVCDKTHSGRINLHGDPIWIKLSESVGQTIWIDRRNIESQVDGSRDWIQVSIESIEDTGVDEMVYTLSVDHPDHQYVAEGIISKNSAGAHIIHDSTFDLLDAIPFGKWGHGTGLINQCHDAVVFEVPMDHEEFRPLDAKGVPDESQREFKWCPPNCTCTANKVARLIKEAMNRSIPGLDGVTFSATPEIGLYWNEV
jgi:hypothetical protein